MDQRITAARAAGITTIFAASAEKTRGGLTVVSTSHITDALRFARHRPRGGTQSAEYEHK
jgi:hypothetical protein